MDPALRAIIEERLLTIQEAATLLGVPRNTLHKRIERGTFPAVKRGNVYLVDRADLKDDTFRKPV